LPAKARAIGMLKKGDPCVAPYVRRVLRKGPMCF
jgi:hypothetical protein